MKLLENLRENLSKSKEQRYLAGRVPKARPTGVADGQQVNIPAPRGEVEPARTLA